MTGPVVACTVWLPSTVMAGPMTMVETAPRRRSKGWAAYDRGQVPALSLPESQERAWQPEVAATPRTAPETLSH